MEWKIERELYEEWYSNEHLIEQLNDPFVEYIDQQGDHQLLDIGCAQSEFVLKYLSIGAQVTAIDEDPLQAGALRRRVNKLGDGAEDRCTIQCGHFPTVRPQSRSFDLCVLSNVLHFQHQNDQLETLRVIRHHLVDDALLHVRVHSSKHYGGLPKDDLRFKQFFSPEDLEKVVVEAGFDVVVVQEEPEPRTAFQTAFITEWITRVHRARRAAEHELYGRIAEYLAEGPLVATWGVFRVRQ